MSPTQVFRLYGLYPRHLIQQSQQSSVEVSIIIRPSLDQLDESRKHPFLVHHLECSLICPTVDEEERGDEMECVAAVFLSYIISISLDGLGA